MKRILFVVLALLFVVGCSDKDIAIHENVNKELATDTIQVMDRIVYNIDNNIEYEDVSEDDKKLFKQFQKKYEDEEGFPVDGFDGVDDDIRVACSVSLYKYIDGTSFDSDKEFIKWNHDLMIKYIETGKSAGE